MTSRNYFGKMNSILGSVVPLAMFDTCKVVAVIVVRRVILVQC